MSPVTRIGILALLVTMILAEAQQPAGASALDDVALKSYRMQLRVIEALGPERLEEIYSIIYGDLVRIPEDALAAYRNYKRLEAEAEKLNRSADPGEWIKLTRVKADLKANKLAVWEAFNVLRNCQILQISYAEAKRADAIQAQKN